jgi:uncharacterized lipoprotein YajG
MKPIKISIAQFGLNYTLSKNQGKTMKTLYTTKKILLSLATTFLLVGCGDTPKETETNTTSTPPTTVTSPKSLVLSLDVSTLNKDANTSLALMATYQDNSTKDLTTDIAWVMTPANAVNIHQHTLTAKKDGNITLQAKVGNTLSNVLKLNITWVVNGHVLPPEPDPAVNDSTLLGVDVNDNGVRDDVERIIYKTYQNKHPIHIDIGMQAARGYKLVLESPERAKEIHDDVNRAGDCEAYYRLFAIFYNEPILINERITGGYFKDKIYFNSQVRKETYNQYDTILSGNTYALPTDKERKEACDFNASKY